jgi:hypothetical protein
MVWSMGFAQPLPYCRDWLPFHSYSWLGIDTDVGWRFATLQSLKANGPVSSQLIGETLNRANSRRRVFCNETKGWNVCDLGTRAPGEYDGR